MKNIFFLIVALLSLGKLSAQYNVGTTSYTFIDSSRANRNIPCEIYYPATSAGTDTPPAAGTFPCITFGHGFVMSIDAYYNFRDTLVNKGYVLILVNTETSFSPNHSNFGQDLLFVNNQYKLLTNTNSSFLLYQHFNGYSAIAGHSMGGGSTFLAGANASAGDVTTLIGFAAAETSPSAIQECNTIQVPCIIFSGSEDGVTPPPQHQIPMYDSLASLCKYHITVTGGGHCLFANTNLACDFGESVSSPGISITRADQQQTTFRYLNLWLDYFLRGNSMALLSINNLLISDAAVTYTKQCSSDFGIEQQGKLDNQVMWSIDSNWLTITLGTKLEKRPVIIQVYDMAGHEIIQQTMKQSQENSTKISLENWKKTTYILTVRVGKQVNSCKFALS